MCRSARCGILRKADMYRSRQLSQRCGARSKLLGSSLSTRKKKPWASGCREMPTQVSGASRILPTQGTAPVPRDEFHPDTPGEDKGASKHHPRPPNLEASLASERKLSYSGTVGVLGRLCTQSLQTTGGKPITPRSGPTKSTALGVLPPRAVSIQSEAWPHPIGFRRPAQGTETEPDGKTFLRLASGLSRCYIILGNGYRATENDAIRNRSL